MASSCTTETTIISVLAWWWSKNNCTIARHDSRKKITFVAGKNQRAPHPSACLTAGSARCLSGAVQFGIPLLQLAPPARPRQERELRTRRSPPVTESRCCGGGDPGTASHRVRITRLAARRRCKALPTALFWSQNAPSQRLPPLLPCGANPASREGEGMANLRRNSLKAKEQIAAETRISVLVGG